MSTLPGSSTAELGRLLKSWRSMRRISQMELSLETGISQRHLSFIESGRSAPTRQTLMMVADGLDMPFRERNQLLLAAGYAPLYAEASWDATSFGIVRGALERMLTQHEPFPALVMDRYWNVVLANRTHVRPPGHPTDSRGREPPTQLLLSRDHRRHTARAGGSGTARRMHGSLRRGNRGLAPIPSD